ncbi:armadillo-type protein [Lyophyllum atratum]|nr:armadillo-type protein [Lyophyllum atratum]
MDDDELRSQAAVGRLSSMSLMAAVTASGSLGEEAQDAFVKEVVRVGQDSVYWVRREASFALGALAKVAPLPLFEILRRDPVWHVRHSVLFALPAILLRISSDKRRALALDTMMALSADESPAVRFGVLEALGEVIYTFQQDKEGPPEELVELFLGRRDDLRARDGEQPPSNEFVVERPHICAFNYPAVALTLGRERWPELREVYLEIARNRTMKVRRTLAASLGELAKIIGQECGCIYPPIPKQPFS